MNKLKLFGSIVNSQNNVRFGDFVIILETFGFQNERTEGSHNIFIHNKIPKIINVQNDKGKAKPYQIRQFLRLIEKYNLKMEGE